MARHLEVRPLISVRLQRLLPGRRTLWALPVFALVVVGLGCSRSTTLESTAKDKAKTLGALPGLKATPDRALQDELARIVEEGGTPELLAAVKIPPESNVAAKLISLFERVDRQEMRAIREEADELWPEGTFTFGPVEREKAIRFRERFERERLAARTALRLPECRFPIAYESGPVDSLAFLDTVWVCARLEAFRVAELLPEGDVDSALESLGYLLRLAECVAAEAHPIVRLEGAFLRTEAFVVLQAIAGNDKFQRRHASMVHSWLVEQLATWPDDSLAWIGDRAQGMVFYEAVRDGKLLKFMTDEEKSQFQERGSLSAFEDAVLRDVNSDQLYYLRAMRKIIESCQYPYHVRADDFEELRRSLHEKRNASDFPLVAGRLLLPDIEKGHVIQARDRANCEGWVLALALATGKEPPDATVNPLTGTPYRVERDGRTILVFDIGTGEDGDNPPWIVPDFANASFD